MYVTGFPIPSSYIQTGSPLHEFNTGLRMNCDIKQLFTAKTLLILANITFTVISAVQLCHVLEGYFKPTTTRTWEEEVPLKDMDFPLAVKVCVIPWFNQSALVEMGYDNTWRQGCISCGPCSYPELTKDHVLPSA